MKHIASSVVGFGLILGACANQQPAAPLSIATEVPVAVETTPSPPTGAQLLAQQPAEVQAALKQYQQDGKWPVYRTAEYTLYPYDQQPEPVIDCAPLRTTDLQLQPGETITDVAMSDTERWMATPAASGDPRNAVPDLAVKPQAGGLETNLTIYTTKHIYHVLLRSRGRALQEVEFYYPKELLAAMKEADIAAAQSKQEAVDPPADLGSAARTSIRRSSTLPTRWAARRCRGSRCGPSTTAPTSMCRCPRHEVERGAGAADQRGRRDADGQLPGGRQLLRRRPAVQRRDSGLRRGPASRTA
jgi:hypothetical protein